jgi:hypothetical protein
LKAIAYNMKTGHFARMMGGVITEHPLLEGKHGLLAAIHGQKVASTVHDGSSAPADGIRITGKRAKDASN